MNNDITLEQVEALWSKCADRNKSLTAQLHAFANLVTNLLEARTNAGSEAVLDENQKYADALAKICQWADAYPVEVFPEPDFKKATSLLNAGGISLDSVSASCMRHVITGVGRIARAALSNTQEKAG